MKTAKEFGREVADRVWGERQDLRGTLAGWTADRMLGIYVRSGGANDHKFAASAARYATKRWLALRGESAT